jgi:hypothetical protein
VSQQQPRPTLQQICASLQDRADEFGQLLLEQWKRIGRDEPWLALPEGISQNDLPDLIRALAAAAASGFADPAAKVALVEFAAGHGESRLREGFPEDLIFREYHLLRRTLWRRLEAEFGKHATAHEFILAFDAGITLATSASLRGYHRSTYEARNDWPDTLYQLVDEPD